MSARAIWQANEGALTRAIAARVLGALAPGCLAVLVFGTFHLDECFRRPDLILRWFALPSLGLVLASAVALHHLAGWVRRSRLTQWLSAASVLDYMATFDAVRHGDFPTLSRLLWCGEALPTPSLIYWMELLPHVSFTNLYGPTETRSPRPS